MLRIEAVTRIDAIPETVWARLARLERYAEWNSRTGFRAPAALGQWRVMRVRLFGIRITVPVRILSCDSKRGLRWRGGIPAIFIGEHYFRVEPLGDRQTLLRQGEDFEGICVPLLWPLVKHELSSLHRAIEVDLIAAIGNSNQAGS